MLCKYKYYLPNLYYYIGGINMTEEARKVVNNKKSTDEDLAKIAIMAVNQKDEKLLNKLRNHPNADWKTLCTIVMRV